ncbi:ATP-binding protein [Streptomyces sp. NPDC093982]|uniref:ATP-binding protein n=1 Tax=Streptomyces sp. NPDC093982 TaxID=3155077 RepID=UPI003435F79B
MNGTRQAGTGKVAEEFPREPETARAARRLVESALEFWHLTALTDDAELVISELVANAVRHTKGPQITVSVDLIAEQRVRLGVTDGSRAMPHLHRPRLVTSEAVGSPWSTP